MADPERIHTPNMIITTPRLILRDMDLSDECCAALFRVRTHPKVTQVLNFKPSDDPSSIKDWIRDRLKKPNCFGFIIELRHPDDPATLGTSVNIIGSAGANRTPEFGYSIDPDHWGKGYATEAMKAILDAFWDTWPNGMASLPKAVRNEAWIRTSQENPASVAVARKLGFTYIGDEVLHSPGGTFDGKLLLKYKLDRPDGGADRPRAYEKIERLGENTCEGLPIDE